MMHSDVAALLPKDKYDTAGAEALVTLGFPAVEPVLPVLLQWMQDMNWPVAHVLQPFLAGIGAPLAPHLQAILRTDDDIWKAWMLCGIVADSAELRTMLKADLQRLATSQTPGEQAEELARQLLD